MTNLFHKFYSLWEGRQKLTVRVEKQDKDKYILASILHCCSIYDFIQTRAKYDLYECDTHSCQNDPLGSLLISLFYIEISISPMDAEEVLSDILNRIRQLPLYNYPQGVFVAFKGHGKNNDGTSLLVSKLALILRKYGENLDGPSLFYFAQLLLSFQWKLNLHLDIEDKLTKEYEEFEEWIHHRTLDSLWLNRVKEVIKDWKIPYTFDVSAMRHGPGAVADQKGRKQLVKDRGLVPSIRNLVYFPEVSFRNQTRIETPVSRLLFVPKSVKTYRTICCEPVINQFLQQGVMGGLVKCLPTLNNAGIHLDDTSRSVRLCQKASLDGSLATIDLSNASDSVGIDLIHLLFRQNYRQLWRHLVGCRTPLVQLPDGRLISIKKFAPMGSAVCFPIECIIFMAIVEACYRLHHIKLTPSNTSVYGDDIIVDTRIVGDVLDALVALGFKPNEKKSFFHANVPFRESCGGEFFKGVDVKPVRLAREFSPTNLEGLVSLANRFQEIDFRLARRLLLKVINPTHNKIPFSIISEVGIVSPLPTNFHLQKKKSGYHTYLVTRGLKAVDTEGISRVSQSEALETWLRLAEVNFSPPQFTAFYKTGERELPRLVSKKRHVDLLYLCYKR